MRDSDYDFIRELVYSHSRINLGPDKRELVSARLGKRLRATNITSISDYCRFLQQKESGDELAHLIDAISTNHTFFFREPQHFEFLTKTLIPEMEARRAAAKTTVTQTSASPAAQHRADHATSPPRRHTVKDPRRRVAERGKGQRAATAKPRASRCARAPLAAQPRARKASTYPVVHSPV